MTLAIRPATKADQNAVWAMLKPVLRASETYVIDPKINREDALHYWFAARPFMALDGGEPLGTYYLRDNQAGGGAHVCNAGFVTSLAAQGRGVARKMLDHALETAKELGYRAMQFNFVVSTNDRAVATWHRAGFETVGRLPGAFRHPVHGFVDALVMYKDLT